MTAEQRAYERTGSDPDGLYQLQPCTKAGHIEGCPGKAGGDHELRPDWIAFEQDGMLIEVEVDA
jgi:hypothetical protein